MLVVLPVPSPVRRTVWPEDAALEEEVLLAMPVDRELVLAAGVVTLEAEEALEEVLLEEVAAGEVDTEELAAAEVVVFAEVVAVVFEEDVVERACAEASTWKATRDRAAAAVATISIILFIA